MTVTVTPEQFIALKRAEYESYIRKLDGGFDEGYFLNAARMILGDDAVLPYQTAAIIVDWHSHGAKLIRVNDNLSWSVIDHTPGYCAKCDQYFHALPIEPPQPPAQEAGE